jgi:hypothetical protein
VYTCTKVNKYKLCLKSLTLIHIFEFKIYIFNIHHTTHDENNKRKTSFYKHPLYAHMNKILKLGGKLLKIIQTFVRNVDKDPRVVKIIILKF